MQEKRGGKRQLPVGSGSFGLEGGTPAGWIASSGFSLR